MPVARQRCEKNLQLDFCTWLAYLLPSMRGFHFDQIATRFKVSRRTAERMRDAIVEVFPQLEEIEGERPKRWRLPSGLSGIFREPLADELAALRGIARRLAHDGLNDSAGVHFSALADDY